ncbi:MAG: hypothetical protein AAFP03_11270 [Cyanobacteria bacterium J06598_3]
MDATVDFSKASLNPDVMKAVESLKYRVTVGDVATRAGLNVEIAQQGLLALASETQAHLQVSDAGEIAYEFPKNFRGVLRNKYWQLRVQALLSKVWQVVFYLIRLSFGIMLLLSIAVIFIAIAALMIAASSQGGGGGNRDNRRGGGGFGFGLSPFNIFYLFDFNYRRGRARYPNRSSGRYSSSGRGRQKESGQLNFLEAIFSFLFGDGDPNADLEARRWQTIGTVINNNGGAIAAEQVAPYLDSLGEGWDKEYEDYILPVLTRFNGRPEVSPQGDIVYYFPELQVSAIDRGKAAVSAYLKETKRQFTAATSSQVMMAIGLGSLNLIGAAVLWNMLQNAGAAALVGYVGFVQSIFWLLLGYGIAFLSIPLVRYYWMLSRNAKIEQRNEERSDRAIALNRLGPALEKKLAFAQQFAQQKVLRADEAVYDTQTDLLEQESDRDDQIEAEFRRRLEEI